MEKVEFIEVREDPEYIRELVAKKAAQYFAAGYNCAEAILLALSQHWKLESKVIPNIATCFGAGIGRKGSICGAVTGCIMALGLKMGRRDYADEENKERAYAAALEFYSRFEKQFGSVFCSSLTKCDLATMEGKRKYANSNLNKYLCEKLVKQAVMDLLAIINEFENKENV
ncbi:MAG: C-GCAxxG-C-C family protein [Methanocellales archaeon]